VTTVSLADVSIAIRFGMAVLFITSSIPKLADEDAFVTAVWNYDLLSPRTAVVVARVIPRLEILIGAALALGVLVRPMALVSAALLLSFAGGVMVNLVRGRPIDCGCAGAVAPRRIGWGLVVADCVAVGLACVLAAGAPTRIALDAFIFRSEGASSGGTAIAMLLSGVVAAVGYLNIPAWLAVRARYRSLRSREVV
jgi:hypothetical protein